MFLKDASYYNILAHIQIWYCKLNTNFHEGQNQLLNLHYPWYEHHATDRHTTFILFINMTAMQTFWSGSIINATKFMAQFFCGYKYEKH